MNAELFCELVLEVVQSRLYGDIHVVLATPAEVVAVATECARRRLNVTVINSIGVSAWDEQEDSQGAVTIGTDVEMCFHYQRLLLRAQNEAIAFVQGACVVSRINPDGPCCIVEGQGTNAKVLSELTVQQFLARYKRIFKVKFSEE
jgi:hypothetical protein